MFSIIHFFPTPPCSMGALQSQVKCLSCGMELNKVDEIMDISLDVMHSGSLN